MGRIGLKEVRQPNTQFLSRFPEQVQTWDHGWSAPAQPDREERIPHVCGGKKGSDRSGMTVDWPVRCDKRLPCVRRIGLWRLSGSREISRRVAVRQLRSSQGCCCEVEGRLTRGILGPPAE